MTHYLVKEPEGGISLYNDSGVEILSGVWGSRPTVNEIANEIAEEAAGGSLWGNSELRSAMIDVLSGGVNWRDLTIPDETVPWQ